MKPYEFHSRLVSSLCKVLPQTAPDSPDLTHLGGLWGETLSFQLAFTTSSPANALTENIIHVAVDSPLADRIRMRSVINVPVMLPVCGETDDYYLSKQPGMYPDLLRSLPPFHIRAVQNQWRSLWFDLALDDTIQGGSYPICLRVYSSTDKGDSFLSEHFLTLEVIPVALPAQSLIHTQWFHGDCLADYYKVKVFSERHWEIMKNFIDEMGSHGINMILTPLFTPPLDTGAGMERTTIQLVDIFLENGNYRFDFSRLSRFIKMCLGCGIRYFEMVHLFTQWGAKYAPKIMVYEDGILKKKFGWHTPAMSPEYKNFLSVFLPQLTGFLKAEGIAEQCYFHISDEPSYKDLDSYSAAEEFVRPMLTGFHRLDALSDYRFYETGCVTRPVVANDHIQPFLDQHVANLWTYYCTSQHRDVSNRFIAMPSARCRVLGLQLYLFQIEGFLQWGYNFYNLQHSTAITDPYSVTDSGDAFQAGDPYLVYPGKDGYPEESIRLMSTCEALFDLRALQLLEQLRSREYVCSLINSGLKNPVTFSCYPHGEKWLLELRRNINREIRLALSDRS